MKRFFILLWLFIWVELAILGGTEGWRVVALFLGLTGFGMAALWFTLAHDRDVVWFEQWEQKDLTLVVSVLLALWLVLEIGAHAFRSGMLG